MDSSVQHLAALDNGTRGFAGASRARIMPSVGDGLTDGHVLCRSSAGFGSAAAFAATVTTEMPETAPRGMNAPAKASAGGQRGQLHDNLTPNRPEA